MTTLRIARVTNRLIPLSQVEAFLPSNYTAMQMPSSLDGGVVILGYDRAGWTMEDYVQPRLASGLIFVEVL